MLDFGFYNMDCLAGMREFPDNYFELAVVDPPYGDGGGTWKTSDGTRFGPRFDKYRGPDFTGNTIQEAAQAEVVPDVERRGGQWAAKYGNNIIAWDVAPDQTYFDELFRISKNQIIWGGGIISSFLRRDVF